MRPSTLVLLAASCLAAVRASAEAPALDPGAKAFWAWFAGDARREGAYRSPPIACADVHRLVNQYKASGKRFVPYQDQEYAYSFFIALGANRFVCMGTDERAIAPKVLLPSRIPTEYAAWLETHDGDKSVRRALAAYLAAADDPDDPMRAMAEARKSFFAAAFKELTLEPAFRVLVCESLGETGPGCLERLPQREPGELYSSARRAMPAPPAAPAAPPAEAAPARAPSR